MPNQINRRFPLPTRELRIIQVGVVVTEEIWRKWKRLNTSASDVFELGVEVLTDEVEASKEKE